MGLASLHQGQQVNRPQYLKNDPTYIGSYGYDNPKECFKLLVELIKTRYDSNAHHTRVAVDLYGHDRTLYGAHCPHQGDLTT